MASIRVHLFLSNSDPELIQTHPSNLLMTNLPRTSLIIAKEVSLFTYVPSIQAFLKKFPSMTLSFQSVVLKGSSPTPQNQIEIRT